jgi:hypothetical protein
MVTKTDEQFTLSVEKFTELATMELDGVREALRQAGVPDQDVRYDSSDRMQVRETGSNRRLYGPALTWDAVQIIVTRATPKNPRCYANFLACWIGVEYYNQPLDLWRAHKPERIRFRRGHLPFVEVAAKLKTLHDLVQAEVQTMNDQTAKVDRCYESSKNVLKQLYRDFDIEIEADWDPVLKGLDVTACRDQEDVVDVSIVAPSRYACATVARLAALQALLPVGIKVSVVYSRLYIKLRANYEQAVYSIKVLSASIDPKLFFEFEPELE